MVGSSRYMVGRSRGVVGGWSRSRSMVGNRSSWILGLTVIGDLGNISIVSIGVVSYMLGTTVR